MNDHVRLVKNQIDWYKSQIARHPPEHPRYRPDHIAMYQRLIKAHESLLAFLESLPGAGHTMPSAPPPPVAKPSQQDLSDLPPELLKELSGSVVKGDTDPLVEIIDARGGVATLDEILIDMFRKHGEVNKRNLLANKLYRLSKRHLVWAAPGRKGVYSTSPPNSEGGDNLSKGDVTLFNRESANQRP